MDWHSIPSLSALRAFEATHRTGSFSSAARELNVTHAAIAQHVRTLENFFGTPLMRRQSKGMVVTEAGERLVLPLREGFARIADGVASLRKSQSEDPLILSVTPSFAENWLMPRLGRFWAEHPEIALTILPTQELVDFRTSNVDIAIRYGRGFWPGLEAKFLSSAQKVIIASPELAARKNLTGLEDLKAENWIIDEAHMEVRLWLDALEIELPEERIRILPTDGMMISAVREGMGIGVLPEAVAEQDIAEGRLKVLYEAQEEGLAYWIVTRKTVLPERVQQLRRWLFKVA